MKNQYILGLNIYHGDSSACLMKNGSIVFAIEEERINRIKHWAGFPLESIKACLEHEKISLNELDFIAINTNPFSNILNKIKYGLSNIRNINFYLKKIFIKKKKVSFQKILKKEFQLTKIPKIKFYDHHHCHLASSHYPSNYKESLLISVDGFGDFTSTCAAIGLNNKIKIKHKILFPHSLGIFYQAFTQLLGFKNYGDEYKVMGLSAYGKNSYKEQIDKIIKIKKQNFYLDLNYFRHHSNNIKMLWDNQSPKIDDLYNDNLQNLFNFDFKKEISQEHMDLAFGVQNKFEEIILQYIRYFKDSYGMENLSLSGGCAMNSLANGRIIEELKFNNIYIPPSPGDAGGAIGAAILCSNDNPCNEKSNIYYSNPYLGTSLDTNNLKNLIDKKINKYQNKEKISVEYIEDENILVNNTAKDIFDNNIVGWYQNRMEWGPRALGNRSILANPCERDMKKIINLKIKRRENFRPFAPSILKEKTNEWFENIIDVPYMSIVLKIKKNKVASIPAVAHADGTGRLQTVKESSNPLYHKLISAFEKYSGVPILLNTSFNENEPIVNTPEQAINCFLRTKMDLLVLGKYVIKRKN
ncbi:carbamoyltransferase [Candidatus Pelagibacter sp.]|nr:carbamoyltransferase [Candidatus Pelagibacter sp.]